MQELKSCFAPPNYHSNKHVTFAQAPIVCSSAPFYWKDDEYSDEDEEISNNLRTFDDDEEQQSKSLSQRHYSFFFALLFVIFSIILLINIRHSPSSSFSTDGTGFMNTLSNTYLLRSIINFII